MEANFKVRNLTPSWCAKCNQSVTCRMKWKRSFWRKVLFLFPTESFQRPCQHRCQVNQHKRCQRFLHWSCGEGVCFYFYGSFGQFFWGQFLWDCDVTSPPLPSPPLFSPSLLSRVARTDGLQRTWNSTSLTTPTRLTYSTHSSELMCFLFWAAYQAETGTNPALVIASQRGAPC